MFISSEEQQNIQKIDMASGRLTQTDPAESNRISLHIMAVEKTYSRSQGEKTFRCLQILLNFLNFLGKVRSSQSLV